MHHIIENSGVRLSPLFAPCTNSTEKAQSKDRRADQVRSGKNAIIQKFHDD